MALLEVTTTQRIKVRIKRFLAGLAQGLKIDRLVERMSPRGVFIFCYHRIIDPTAQNWFVPFIAVSKENLTLHLTYLKANCVLLSLGDALKRIQSGRRLDRDCAVATFDDGYRDNRSLGAAIFESLGVSPTVFVVTALPENNQLYWADRLRFTLYTAKRRAVVSVKGQTVDTSSTGAKLRTLNRLMKKVKAMTPVQREDFLLELAGALESQTGGRNDGANGHPRLMLSWAEIRELESFGVDIGAHTHTHEILSDLDDSTLKQQLSVSKALIEERTGRPCVHFSYPNGARRDYSSRAIELLRDCGFESAVSLVFGCNLPGEDPYQLKRIPVTLFDGVEDLKLKMLRARLDAIARTWWQG